MVTTFLKSNQCCAYGGLITYVHKQFVATVLTDNKEQPSGCDVMCDQLSDQKPLSKQYILCNIYRTPNEAVDDINTFINELCSILVIANNFKHSA